MSPKIMRFAGGLTALALTACGISPREQDRGISPREARVLTANFYWKKSDPRFDDIPDRQLAKIITTAADPKLNGERWELRISEVAVALATVGDNRFARVLSAQSPSVIGTTTDAINSLWTRSQLIYPETQRLWEKYRHLKLARE